MSRNEEIVLLPEITILNANEWHSPTGIPASRPRFVTKYELECYLGDGGETCIDGERGLLLDKSLTFSRPGQIRNSKFPFSTIFIYFDLTAPNADFEELIGRIPAFIRPDDGAAELVEQNKVVLPHGAYESRGTACGIIVPTCRRTAGHISAFAAQGTG